ncbi:MAG TPA: beta-propeller fold lactonase family protein [Thermoanaerobaculia bacterium]|nr:beta-propeller fold lactonase family protein [Thermoanaerobaculia bacterium]
MLDFVEEQRIRPLGGRQRFEGIAFAPDGSSLAVATSEANVLLLYRHTDGRLAEEPFATIAGARSRLEYPHDVAFSAAGDLMAVAQRKGAVAVYEREGEGFASDPAFVIRGPRTRLYFSDGVAFVPPGDDALAVCNLKNDSISFYRMTSRSPLAFELTPSREWKGDAIFEPDGLAFSDEGRWLAVANHGNNTVAIFECGAADSAAVTILRHRSFRFPHSVAFTPGADQLLVTNAGANYFSVFERHEGGWSRSPVARHIVGPDRTFREVNARCKAEGGPKGIAVHGEHVAICSPEQGIVLYTLQRRKRLAFLRR